MKITKKLWFASTIALTLLFSAYWTPLAQAQESSWLNVVIDNGLRDIGNAAFDTPDQPQDIRVIVANVIQIILGLLGTIFVVLAVIAGIRWMTANGNDKAIGTAKSTLYTAVIGLLIVLAAFAVTIFITRVSIGVTQEEGYLDSQNIPRNE